MKQLVMRKDLYTGENFYPSRVNQKFKTSQNRIDYYNNIQSMKRSQTAYVNKPLWENFNILNSLFSNDKKLEKVVHKQFLIGKGFHFNVHTHYQNHQNKQYLACYNFLIITNGDNIKIIKIVE